MDSFDLEEIRKKRKQLNSNAEITSRNMDKIIAESERVANVADNASQELYKLEMEFEKKTGLQKADIPLLFVAIGLQLVRQYLLTSFQTGVDDKAAAKEVKDGKLNKTLHEMGNEDTTKKGWSDEHSDRKHKYYNPSLHEIITNPVPFDANIGADGALKGANGHRAATLGHDPVLGLIFGTANIATSTLTTNKMVSYHIKTDAVKVGYGKVANKDVFGNKAKTELVLKKTVDKLFYEGKEGKVKVVCAFLKEIIHLQSDVNSKKSLPLPIINSVDEKFASQLADHGFNMLNVKTVLKQATYASMINFFIVILHKLIGFNVAEEEKDLYEVRTRKIISYSNAIASGSNAIWVVANVIWGDKSQVKKLDIGGLIVTVQQLVNNEDFRMQIKKEVVFGKFDKLIEGEKLELEDVIWE